MKFFFTNFKKINIIFYTILIKKIYLKNTVKCFNYQKKIIDRRLNDINLNLFTLSNIMLK